MRSCKSTSLCRGFTYIAILMALALFGVGLAAAGQVWSTTVRRDKEHELMFIGSQFRRALESYARASPGAARFPHSLDELVLDRRFPVTRRHLRKIYVDPMTGRAEWGVVRRDGMIVAVYSLSQRRPILNREELVEDGAGGMRAPRYSDWLFAAGIL